MRTILDHAACLAFIKARKAAEKGEIPVGAVVFDQKRQKILAAAGNAVETTCDPTAHAEILALKKACRALDTTYLTDCDLYVTLEPCAMCAAAVSFARIRRLYFGAYDVKSGGVEHGACVYRASSCHHAPEVYGGIGEKRAKALLTGFFADLRKGTAP